MVAVVDSGSCAGCGCCTMVCPVKAISISMVAEINKELCTACGECVTSCPTDAISLQAR